MEEEEVPEASFASVGDEAEGAPNTSLLVGSAGATTPVATSAVVSAASCSVVLTIVDTDPSVVISAIVSFGTSVRVPSMASARLVVALFAALAARRVDLLSFLMLRASEEVTFAFGGRPAFNGVLYFAVDLASALRDLVIAAWSLSVSPPAHHAVCLRH